MSESIPTGPLAGGKMDEEKYNGMFNEYYDLCGWYREISLPTRKALID
jgi:hypothetical protein